MKKSPWAKFRTPSTPNSRASPAATSASDAPTTRPFSAATITVSTGSVLSLQVGGDQLLRAGQVAQLVLARDHSALHHVETAAHRLEQVEGGVDDQHPHPLRDRPLQRPGDEVDVDGHEAFARLVDQDQFRPERQT